MISSESANYFYQSEIGSNTGFLNKRNNHKNCNRKMHQRHSLNVNSYHQMPSVKRGSILYEKKQVS